jgi:hypothetical protein
MRPPTPRLRINSEDVDLSHEPSFKNTQDDRNSQTLFPPQPPPTNPFSSNNTTHTAITDNDFIADLIANSDPNDISVL